MNTRKKNIFAKGAVYSIEVSAPFRGSLLLYFPTNVLCLKEFCLFCFPKTLYTCEHNIRDLPQVVAYSLRHSPCWLFRTIVLETLCTMNTFYHTYEKTYILYYIHTYVVWKGRLHFTFSVVLIVFA